MKIILLSFLLVFLSVFAFSQAAGEAAANVKVIDADMIFPFMKGSAVIIKGTSYALIDNKASFIVPFNFYKEIMPSAPNNNFKGDPPAAGIYEIVTTQKRFAAGFINELGKTIFTPPPGINYSRVGLGIGENGYGSVELYSPTNFAWGKKFVYFNSEGVILFNAKQGLPVDGLSIYNDAIDYRPGKQGYKDVKGKIIVNAQFDAARDFSDGLAAVAKKNEFGELKWGYIDKKGKIVIPFKYSKQPGDFGNGLACVIPVVVEDFKMAFINKQGEIVFKIPINSPVPAPTLEIPKFIDGYFFLGSEYLTNNGFMFAIDTTGITMEANDLFTQFGLPKTYLMQTKPFYHQQMFYAKECTNQICKKGILDFKTKKYTPAIFDELSMFDPIANLAYAKLFLRHDNINNKDIYREGYINKDGVFVIIKGEPEKF